MAAFAVNKLAAFELLIERRTHARAACAARVVRHLHHRHALPLLDDALELAAQPLRQRGLELLRAFAQRPRLGTEVAEGVLPLVVLRVPALFERQGTAAIVIELILQPFYDSYLL